jgi:hypothetical protein
LGEALPSIIPPVFHLQGIHLLKLICLGKTFSWL